MHDFKRQIEKLENDAIECDLIAKLAIDNAKRDAFARLAEEFHSLAQLMKRELQKFSDERGYDDLAQKLRGHELVGPETTKRKSLPQR
mgnify:CR=1 FL=1